MSPEKIYSTVKWIKESELDIFNTHRFNFSVKLAGNYSLSKRYHQYTHWYNAGDSKTVEGLLLKSQDGHVVAVF